MKILIVGIGNEFRNDDGIGLEAAKILKVKNFKDIEIASNNGDGALLMDLWKDFDKVYLIDAVQSDNKAGTIHKIDLKKKQLEKDNKKTSSHLFGLYDAVETARVMNTLPTSMTFYGIAGSNFDFGKIISPEVSSACNEVIRIICEELKLN